LIELSPAKARRCSPQADDEVVGVDLRTPRANCLTDYPAHPIAIHGAAEQLAADYEAEASGTAGRASCNDLQGGSIQPASGAEDVAELTGAAQPVAEDRAYVTAAVA